MHAYIHTVYMYVCIYVYVYVYTDTDTDTQPTTVVHLIGGTRGCKECGGASMCEHNVLPVSDPHSSEPQKNNCAQGKELRWQFLSLHLQRVHREGGV